MKMSRKILALVLVLCMILPVFSACNQGDLDYDTPDLDVSSYAKTDQFKYYTKWLSDEVFASATEKAYASSGADLSDLLALGPRLVAFGRLVEKKFKSETGSAAMGKYLESAGYAINLLNEIPITESIGQQFLNQMAVARSAIESRTDYSELMTHAACGREWITANGPETLMDLILAKQSDENTLVITFGGNTFLGNPENDWDSGFNASYANRVETNYYPFSNLLGYFLTDDLTIVNYEGNLTNATATKADGWNGLAEYADVMARCGIDVVSLNSEHNSDFLLAGLEETAQHFETAGITSYYDQKTAYIDTKLGKLALISYNVVDTKMVLDGIIRQDMKAAHAKGAIIIIVNFHWGEEFNEEVTSTQQKYAGIASNLGADLVIGSHPHLVQGLAYTKINRGIFYSLGDLCNADDRANEHSEGCLVQVTVKRSGKKYDFTDFRVIPIVRKDFERHLFMPMPATGKQKTAIINKMNASGKKLKNGVQLLENGKAEE